MKYLTLILFIIITNTVSQAQTPILTEKENTAWLEAFEAEKLSEQLKMLRKRIADDSTICLRSMIKPCGFARHAAKKDNCNRPSTKNTLSYIFSVAGRKSTMHIRRTPDMDYRQIIKMGNFITDSNTSQITVMKQPIASALYGTSATFGVLQVELTYAETFESLARLFDREL